VMGMQRNGLDTAKLTRGESAGYPGVELWIKH